MLARLVVLAAVASLPVVLSAQSSGPTSRGNALVGGSASILRASNGVDGDDDDESVTNLEFSPHILYFVAPRLALGGTLAYARTSGGGSTSSNTIVGPEVRLFFADPTAKAQPFVSATVARQWGSFDTPTGAVKPRGTRYGASAGVIAMVSRQVGISSELFYTRSTDDALFGGDEITSSAFGLRFGFAAFLMR